MKLLKIALVTLMFLVNLVVAQPSWADDKPKFDQNPDYIELTKAIGNLLQAKDPQDASPEEAQRQRDARQQLANLMQYQKYILETGEGWGQCRNETGKALAVYGPKPKKSNSDYDNALYFLADGQTTEEKWDCDGVFLPSGSKVAGLNPIGPVAAKIVDGTQLVAKTNPKTGMTELNVPPSKLFKAGDIKWPIPDISQAAMDARFPDAPFNS